MPDTAPAFAIGFSACTEEVEIASLPVTGVLPAWLRGTLYRNGPALWQVGSTTLTHWFDGMAKLHRVEIAADGTVAYRSRMLQSEQYRRSLKRGRLWWRLFATEQKRRWYHKLAFLLRPFYGDNALVHIVPMAGGMAALTEAPRTVRIDPVTLGALGDLRFTDRIVGHNTTAHPLVDPRNGETINLLTKYGKVTRHQFVRMAPGACHRELIGTIDASEPSYHHSFGLTERFIIFTEWPFVLNPLRVLLGDSTIYGSYRWKPELGLRVRLLERATGRVLGPFRSAAAFAFHHVNAYDHDDGLSFDVACFDDQSVFDDLLIEQVRRAGIPHVPRLRRYHLDLASGGLSHAELGVGAFDFPVIDERQRCRPTTIVWGCGEASAHADGMLNRLVRREVSADAPSTERTWDSPGHYPGEPLFVPRPEGSPHEGVLISVVLDGERRRSYIVILEATSMQEIARIDLPQVVPFGFHGSFVPA